MQGCGEEWKLRWNRNQKNAASRVAEQSEYHLRLDDSRAGDVGVGDQTLYSVSIVLHLKTISLPRNQMDTLETYPRICPMKQTRDGNWDLGRSFSVCDAIFDPLSSTCWQIDDDWLLGVMRLSSCANLLYSRDEMIHDSGFMVHLHRAPSRVETHHNL